MMRRRIWDKINIKRYFAEIKVGIFFLFAFALLFYTLFSIREISLFKGTYIIKVEFDFAEGLRAASPVRFCGVDVGEVKKVEVVERDGRPGVLVFAKIEKGILIPKQSYFFINSLSLFGEKYLEVTPSARVKNYIREGEIVEGISPIPLFNVFATFTKTMQEVSDFVKEGKIKKSFENTLLNMEQASIKIKQIIEDMGNKEGTVGRFLYDDSIYRKTEDFIEDIKANPWKLLYKPRETRKRN
ncbi:MAG: MCE family protein [Candidatus Omnitrophota bacterium]|nr:MAG: MCE family protein [Candidatus Omnitrophota bacterium]